MHYQNFTRLFTGLNTLPVLEELSDDLWKADTYLRDYPQGPFGDTESVILRFPPRTVHQTEAALREHLANFDQHENVWLEPSKLLPHAKELALWLMNGVQGTRLGRVMINKMEPGGVIYRHADTPVHARYWSRFHIVLFAKPGNDFHCGNEVVNMLTGEVWYFRNDLEHEVINNSNEARIHMVVDIKCDIQKPKVESLIIKPINIEYPKGISFHVEKLADVVEELKPFVPIHWAELGLTKDEIPVDMDWQRYLAMEEKGNLHMTIVRDSGKVIGYQFTLVGGHLHYKSSKHAMVDLYFLLPEYRKGMTGIKMFKYAEAELKKIGCVKIITGCKLFFDHTRIFEHLGYEKSDYQFIKLLK